MALPAGVDVAACNVRANVYDTSLAGNWVAGAPVSGTSFVVPDVPLGDYTVAIASSCNTQLGYADSTAASVSVAGTTNVGTINVPAPRSVTFTFRVPQSHATGTYTAELRAWNGVVVGTKTMTPNAVNSLTGTGTGFFYVSISGGPTPGMPVIYSGNSYTSAKASVFRASQAYDTFLSPIDYSTMVFADVASTTQYAMHIAWLREKAITTGYDDGTFRPLGAINRDAMAAFLYRYAGSPEFTPDPASCSFSDVPVNLQFRKEICWLASTGITRGYSDGTFRPWSPVNRDTMAAFLYRYQSIFRSAPATSSITSAPFRDVAVSNQFVREIAWLSDMGISTGWSDATFRPTTPVNRDAMAAFLYRFDKLPRG